MLSRVKSGACCGVDRPLLPRRSSLACENMQWWKEIAIWLTAFWLRHFAFWSVSTCMSYVSWWSHKPYVSYVWDVSHVSCVSGLSYLSWAVYVLLRQTTCHKSKQHKHMAQICVWSFCSGIWTGFCSSVKQNLHILIISKYKHICIVGSFMNVRTGINVPVRSVERNIRHHRDPKPNLGMSTCNQWV